MKATTWTLGVLAGVVLLLFVGMVGPRILPQVCPSLEYKYLNMPAGIGQYQVCGELSQLRAQGWRLDDILADSCGNITIILKKSS